MPSQLATLVYKMTLLNILMIMSYHMSSTYLVLYITDWVGVGGFTLLFSAGMVTQTILDYPSGGLGDRFGYRTVLSVAYVLHIIALIVLTCSTDLVGFAFYFFLKSIANSQESGALQSWFDTQYQHLSASNVFDIDRKIYGLYYGRLTVVLQISSAPVFVLSGFLAGSFGRKFLFISQALLTFPVLLFIILYINSVHTSESQNLSSWTFRKVWRSYLRTLKTGVKYVAHVKGLFFFLISQSLATVAITLWLRFIFFFVLIGYTGTDELAGILRSALYLVSIFVGYFTASMSKRLDPGTWIPRLLVLWSVVFFGGYIAMMLVWPLSNTLVIPAVLVMVLILSPASSVIVPSYMIAQRKLMSQVVPSEVRNSVYSLIPTFVTILLPFMALILGELVSLQGLMTGLIFLSSILLLSSLFGLSTRKLHSID